MIAASAKADIVRNLWWKIAAVAVGSAAAHTGTSTLPFQVGSLIETLHFRPSEAGFFGFCEVGSLALGMILLMNRTPRLSHRQTAFIGVIITVLANVLIFTLRDRIELFGCAMLAGFGFAFIFAGTITGTSRASNPDRVYGFGQAGALLLVMIITVLIPRAGVVFGSMAAFVVIALMIGIASPLLFGLDERVIQSAQQRRGRIPRARWAFLLTWASYSFASGAVLTFAERVGRSIGLNPDTIGIVLSSGVFFGVLGTVLTAWTSERMSRRLALSIALVGNGVGSLLLTYAPGVDVYACGVILFWICNMFIYSRLLATAALLDCTGGLGTFACGLERLAYALGPLAAGMVAEHVSYSATGLIGLIFSAAPVLFWVPLMTGSAASAEVVPVETGAQLPA